MRAYWIGRYGALAVALCTFAGCIIPLPIVGGGIAGAGADPLWIRREAQHYPVFLSQSVVVSQLPGANTPIAVPITQYPRDQYFSDFENHADVASGIPGHLNGYDLYFKTSRKAAEGIRIRIATNGNDLIAEKIPRAFYMGHLQFATLRCRDQNHILLAANSRSNTERMWLGIYAPNGRKLFAASLLQNVAHIAPRDCAIAVLQHSGSGLLIEMR